jgi:hypothetical protein
MNQPTNQQYVKAAQRLYNKDGECEIDEFDSTLNQVSHGEDLGAYVQAWVWVPEDEAI